MDKPTKYIVPIVQDSRNVNVSVELTILAGLFEQGKNRISPMLAPDPAIPDVNAVADKIADAIPTSSGS